MAAQWRGKDENIVTGNTEFLTTNAFNEAVLGKGKVSALEMDTHSCLDPSILAMFEDSAVTAETRSRLDEECESTLLTALTEILDSVDDETLSPFDTLPDTGVFSDQRLRDNSPLRRLLSLTLSPPDKEPLFRSIKTPSSSSSPSSSVGKVEAVITDRPRRARLTPRAQASSTPTSIPRSDGEEEERSDAEGEEEEEGSKVHIHSPTQGFNLTNQDSEQFSPDQSEVRPLNSVENDHGYYSTVSLVDLVKLMHPYCLRVSLDKEGEDWVGTPRQEAYSLGERSTDLRVPLEGEVWRYTKPGSEASDEEIDVDGSDDECPSGGGIEKEGDEGQGSRGEEVKRLKSLLVKWDAPKEGQKTKNKKRVSFGPVLVTSYEQPAADEPDLNVFPDLSELTRQIPSSDFNNNTETTTISLTTPFPESSAASSKDNQHQVVTDLSERTGDKLSSEPLPQQGESKPRPALSLQQYRLLRQQKRLPVVAKPENYTTKWPSLPETPKELPPIPCLQGPKHTMWGPTTTHPTHHYIGSTTGDDVSGFKPISKTRMKIVSSASPSKPGKGIGVNGSKPVGSGTKTSLASSALKPNRNSMESKSADDVGILKSIWTETISPASPLPSPNLNSNPVAGLGKNRTRPARSAVAVSSDPPNPVLVPLPGTRPALGGFDRSHGTNQEQQEQEQSPPPSTTQETPAPKPKMVFCNRDPSLKSTGLLLEIQRRFSTKQPYRKTLHTLTSAETMKQGDQPRSLSTRKEIETVPEGSKFSPSAPVMASLSSSPSVHPPTPAVAPYPEMERVKWVALGDLPHVQLSTSPESSSCIQTPNCGTGIEATDLTSLLERFEETQAKEESESEHEASPDRSPVRYEELSNNTEGMLRLLGAYLLSTQETLCLPQPAGIPELVNTLEALRTREPLRTPEPLRSPELCDTQEPLGTQNILSTQNVLSTQEQAPAQPRWKPLTPVAPQRKQPATPKPSPPKAIQIIDPRPLPPKKAHPLPPKPPVTPSQFQTAVSVSSDHDYCLSQDQPGSNTTTLCSKRQTILPDHQPITNSSAVPGAQNSGKYMRQQQPVDSRTVPETELPSDSPPLSTESSPSRTEAITAGETQEERTSPCIPSPPSASPPARGRSAAQRYQTRSSCSDSSSRSPSSSSSSSASSSSRSRSRSPPRKRFCPRRSESSSCSSSCSSSVYRSPVPCRYRLPYPRSWNRSQSRSKSWSRSGSRSRSRSPTTLAYRRAQRWRRDCYSPTLSSTNVGDSRKRKRQQYTRNEKLKAIDERRVVYVGRIQRTMMHAELRERFSLFGEVEECTLHFRDRGDHYGFVTFYNMKDAFAAIENGYKLRRPDELPFDLCFGGRRQFCKSTYADLDYNQEEVDPTPAKSKEEELDFDTLLKQAQKGLKR